jgi:transposase-like protein
MARSRANPVNRLSQEQRFAIVRKRGQGALVADLAQEFGVTPRTIYYTLQTDRSRQIDGRVRTEVVNVRLTAQELSRFDAVLARREITSRAEALRRLIHAASDLFVPDDDLAFEMRGLSAALNRAGNNVNQIAQRLNEAKRRGKTPPYGDSAHAQVRALGSLVFDIADQVQEMAERRRGALSAEVAKVLEGAIDGPE